MASVIPLQNTLADQLHRDGYACIPAFITPLQIQQLEQYFYQTLPLAGLDEPFFTTHWSPSDKYRKQTHVFVQQLLQPTLDKHFAHYRCMLGYYLYKKPSLQGNVYMHKDWSLVDEQQHNGLTLWIPLTDTNRQNGCFQVVPGSHLDPPMPRGTQIPQQYPQYAETDFVDVEARAGEAIVFDHRLLHASGHNTSIADRVAVGLALIPDGVQPVHYYRNAGKDSIEMLPVEIDFLTDTYYNHIQKETTLPGYIQHKITSPITTVP